MRESFKRGIGFGTTTGVITTLALMVGLDVGTGSRLAVLAGVVTIAVADSLSDSLGMHISEESAHGSGKAVWEASLAAFLSKFFLSMTFIIPLLLFSLGTAIFVNIVWGLSMLAYLSYRISLSQKENPWRGAGEHLGLASVVLALTWLVGKLIAYLV